MSGNRGGISRDAPKGHIREVQQTNMWLLRFGGLVQQLIANLLPNLDATINRTDLIKGNSVSSVSAKEPLNIFDKGNITSCLIPS